MRLANTCVECEWEALTRLGGLIFPRPLLADIARTCRRVVAWAEAPNPSFSYRREPFEVAERLPFTRRRYS